MIAAQCPNCRLTESVPAQCLFVEIADPQESDRTSAAWICDSCHALVALPVDLLTVVDLVAAGASVLDSASSDVRPAYPESAVTGPAFTRNDLLEFHELLEADTWLAVVLDPGTS